MNSATVSRVPSGQLSTPQRWGLLTYLVLAGCAVMFLNVAFVGSCGAPVTSIFSVISSQLQISK